MKRGISILLFATLFVGCMKHESVFDEGRVKKEAEKNFPVQNIDPNQDWVMATSRTLDVSVHEKTGENYTIKVFNAYPFSTKKDVRLLAQKDVKDGESATIKFDAPTVLKRIYVVRQSGEEYVVQIADIENERFSIVFGQVEGRSVGAKGVVRKMDTSSYIMVSKDAKQITKGGDLKSLKGGAYYIDGNIQYTGEKDKELSLGKDVSLYIKKGGHLTVDGDLKMTRNSLISVLEGGSLTIGEDLELGEDKGSNDSPVFYNGGTVVVTGNIELKEELKKGLWINEANVTTDEFEAEGKAEIWNLCRLIITNNDDDEAFTLKHAVFNNEGYVHVKHGGAKWEESVINLAGGAVFNITKELEIEDDVELSAIGNTTLIAAGELEIEKKTSLDGEINISAKEVDDDDGLPDGLKITERTITDTGKCTVYTEINPMPEEVPTAVHTYGFEDTVDETTDYDFNDVVLHVSNLINHKIKITLVAAGATNFITVKYRLYKDQEYQSLRFNNGQEEIHAAFGKSVSEMINTSSPITENKDNLPFYEIENIADDNYSFVENGTICIEVTKEGKAESHQIIESEKRRGGVPYSLCVPIAWPYPKERVRIDQVYKDFAGWAKDVNSNQNWYEK